jgi:hypothetical protein
MVDWAMYWWAAVGAAPWGIAAGLWAWRKASTR